MLVREYNFPASSGHGMPRLGLRAIVSGMALRDLTMVANQQECSSYEQLQLGWDPLFGGPCSSKLVHIVNQRTRDGVRSTVRLWPLCWPVPRKWRCQVGMSCPNRCGSRRRNLHARKEGDRFCAKSFLGGLTCQSQCVWAQCFCARLGCVLLRWQSPRIRVCGVQ